MEEDQELMELRKQRDELIEKALNLRDRLNEQKKAASTKRKTINMNTIDEMLVQPSMPDDAVQEQFPAKLIDLTKNAFGITYNNVNKKWLRDSVWLYETQVTMKTFSFNLELIVNEKNNNYEIEDIMCHFLEMDSSLLQEISPWVLSIARSKNFSFLMFAFSEYNEQYSLRKKILNKVVKGKFGTVEKFTKEGGGLIIYIHSPKSVTTHYAEYLWKLQLNTKTRSIEHCFAIECMDSDFMAANRNLIEDFCKSGLKKNDLEGLWATLCSAINEHT